MVERIYHWCGICQIRIYMQRHYGIWLDYKNCPYTCKYAEEMLKGDELGGGNRMTRADISTLNYILGRLEGLACGAGNDVQTGILDTCEMLAELIDKNEKKEETNHV